MVPSSIGIIENRSLLAHVIFPAHPLQSWDTSGPEAAFSAAPLEWLVFCVELKLQADPAPGIPQVTACCITQGIVKKKKRKGIVKSVNLHTLQPPEDGSALQG